MNRLLLLLFLVGWLMPLSAQHRTPTNSVPERTQPPFTPAAERIASMTKRADLAKASLVRNLPATNIGPTVFSGRVVDVDVSPQDPTHFYVAYASGGLWKTTTNGNSFEPMFQNEIVMTIGDLAVDWTRNRIWLGTGEVNSSRSSYAGVGMFLSEDGGTTWEHRGLPETHHIGRIVLHPTDPNTLWVAALGHLYSPNPERGVFKTTDAGKTWRRVLFANANAGAIDLMVDPTDPNVLYAATWERTRRAWNFVESGAGSGIHKSTDGGETWTLLTTENSGFPTGEGVGRIGLAMNGAGTLFAVLDNYFRRDKETDDTEERVVSKEELRSMSKEDYLKLDTKLIERYLMDNNFPKKYSEKEVRKLVERGDITPAALVEYTEDANSLLFDTPVIGAEVYRSDDGGNSWQRTHDGYLDRVYNSYGYYFGQIRTSPHDPQKLYIMGVPVLRSDDGGVSWKNINGGNVHVDHHALWIDPQRAGRLVLGNDGGINISYDDGETWNKCNTPPVGQFYAVMVDRAEPYNVYGGLQDNGVWMGAHTYEPGYDWQYNGRYPYRTIMGGDGMQVMVDTRDNETAYTGFQFGNYFRINTRTDERTYISPRHELGERPLRFNWQTPIHLSVHNQDVLYLGSNKFHRSLNRGDDWETLSDDLTQGGKRGDVAFGTLTTIHESPLRFGLLYAGSDDGRVHVSQDGGYTWTDISAGLPDDLWVTRVHASAHDRARVYVTLNGYRYDDFRSLVYVSDDHGKTWTRIARDLPMEPVNDLNEDAKNKHLLYIGTDHGLYFSLDRGATVQLAGADLPAVAVHDVMVQEQAEHLLVGTHGRSLYRMDVAQLRALTPETLAQDLVVFDLEDLRHRSNWGDSTSIWTPEMPQPEHTVPVYAKRGGTATVSLYHGELKLQEFTTPLDAGLNYVDNRLSILEKATGDYRKALNKDRKADADEIEVKAAKNGTTYVLPGDYRVEVALEGTTAEKTFSVKGR